MANPNTELTGRALDAAIARALGLQIQYIEAGPQWVTDGAFSGHFINAVFTAEREWLMDDWLDVARNMPVKSYSTSLSAAFELQAELERRNLARDYEWALLEVIFENTPISIPVVYWVLITATAEQRARAALRVLTEAAK